MEKVVLILSGGMDSATLLGKLLAEENKEIYCLTFNYGQRHKKEIDCAVRLLEHYRATQKGKILLKEHEIITIPTFGGNALTDDIEVPEGHYASENMKQTVVPNRNMIMLSIAAGYAESINAEKVYYGAHGGDHFIYWDCRPSFLEDMNMILENNDKTVQIVAPFMYLDKGDIASIGCCIGVPYEYTWTCYKGGELACGKCGSCVERLEAFIKAAEEDPIEYEGE